MGSQPVSHSFAEESMEAKTKWFQSLTVEERIEIFCEWTDLAFAANPSLVKGKDVQPVAGRIRVLELPQE
jgi:hypothetical protein